MNEDACDSCGWVVSKCLCRTVSRRRVHIYRVGAPTDDYSWLLVVAATAEEAVERWRVVQAEHVKERLEETPYPYPKETFDGDSLTVECFEDGVVTLDDEGRSFDIEGTVVREGKEWKWDPMNNRWLAPGGDQLVVEDDDGDDEEEERG